MHFDFDDGIDGLPFKDLVERYVTVSLINVPIQSLDWATRLGTYLIEVARARAPMDAGVLLTYIEVTEPYLPSATREIVDGLLDAVKEGGVAARRHLLH